MAVANPPRFQPGHQPLAGMTVSREDWRLAECTSWLEVNLPAIEHNTREMVSLVTKNGAKTQVCAVVKKNAYGLGAVQVASRVAKAGVSMLAVFSSEEAIELIQASVSLPILVLMPFERLTRNDNVLYRHAVQGRLHVALHDADQLQRFNEIARDLALRLPVHLHLDTGMSRGGFSPEALSRLVREELPKSKVQIAGIYTHMASSDIDPQATAAQLKKLHDFCAEHKAQLPENLLIHAANTCATLRGAENHLGMVRVGLGLSGVGAEVMRNGSAVAIPLRQAIAWKSRIIHAAAYKAGATVGYQSTCRLEKDSILGLVPVGYGDGYPLGLANKGIVRVRLKGQPPADCRVLGLVNMDQIIVDLSPAVALSTDPISLKGTEVDVISADPTAPNTLARFSAAAGIHPYAVMCGISAKVHRKYLYQE